MPSALKSQKFVVPLLAALLVLPVLAPVEAQARINGPALDSFSAGCLLLQNDADRLIAEYKNASMARREEILQQLRNIGSDWINIGCKAVFGSIALTLPDQVPNLDIAGGNAGALPPMSLSDGSNTDSGATAPTSPTLWLY